VRRFPGICSSVPSKTEEKKRKGKKTGGREGHGGAVFTRAQTAEKKKKAATATHKEVCVLGKTARKREGGWESKSTFFSSSAEGEKRGKKKESKSLSIPHPTGKREKREKCGFVI